MQTITFAGAKGGVGTTTAAATFALAAAYAGQETVLCAERFTADDHDVANGDLLAVLGLPAMTRTTIEAGPNLTVASSHLAVLSFAPDLMVIDAGTTLEKADVIVTRACYLALRRIVAAPHPAAKSIMLVLEKGRALDAKDVERATDLPVTVVEHDVAVARAVDAGLLAHRLPRSSFGKNVLKAGGLR